MRSGAIGAAVLLTLAVAGCGSAVAPGASPPGAAADVRVGSGCGFIPDRGPGSFRSMSTQPAVAAVASNPQLSVFSSVIKTAALDGRFNARNAFTLFIPVNSAFSALSQSQITYLRNPANLAAVVRRLVVPASVTPARIARGGTVASRSGARLALARRGSQYLVDAATVLCGNIKTADGAIYVIDRVLLPPK